MSLQRRRRPPRPLGFKAVLVYKLAKAPIMLALAIWLSVASRTALGSAEWIARELAEGGAMWSRVADWITAHLTGAAMRDLTIVVWLDAVTTSIEAALLASGKPWGEWIVLLGLAAMVPLEIAALDRHPGWIKVLILGLNLAIVLVLAKRRLKATRLRKRPGAPGTGGRV